MEIAEATADLRKSMRRTSCNVRLNEDQKSLKVLRGPKRMNEVLESHTKFTELTTVPYIPMLLAPAHLANQYFTGSEYRNQII